MSENKTLSVIKKFVGNLLVAIITWPFIAVATIVRSVVEHGRGIIKGPERLKSFGRFLLTPISPLIATYRAGRAVQHLQSDTAPTHAKTSKIAAFFVGLSAPKFFIDEFKAKAAKAEEGFLRMITTNYKELFLGLTDSNSGQEFMKHRLLKKGDSIDEGNENNMHDLMEKELPLMDSNVTDSRLSNESLTGHRHDSIDSSTSSNESLTDNQYELDEVDIKDENNMYYITFLDSLDKQTDDYSKRLSEDSSNESLTGNQYNSNELSQQDIIKSNDFINASKSLKSSIHPSYDISSQRSSTSLDNEENDRLRNMLMKNLAKNKSGFDQSY